MSKSLSKIINAKRTALGIRLEDLAAKTGLSYSYLASIEAGRRLNPSLDALKRLCSALKIDPKEIM